MVAAFPIFHFPFSISHFPFSLNADQEDLAKAGVANRPKAAASSGEYFAQVDIFAVKDKCESCVGAKRQKDN